MTRDQIRKCLQSDEGLSLEVYLDSKGIPTAGRGHAFFGRDVPRVGTVFTLEQCERWFDADIKQAEKDFDSFNFRDLHPIARGVAVMMLFNLGRSRFGGFRNLILALHEHDYMLAAVELLDSKYHREDVPKRAVRYARMLVGCRC
jgi:GH24 family phage-related lysozyme (muramidase)